MMTEYLVRYEDTWHIAHLGVVKAPHKDNPEEYALQLCWAERDGSIICLAGEEDLVQDLPE